MPPLRHVQFGLTCSLTVLMGMLLLVKAAPAQTLTTVYSFPGLVAGGNPYGAPVLDAAGNVYGTTTIGGVFDCYGPPMDAGPCMK